jgi:hypothetical protein
MKSICKTILYVQMTALLFIASIAAPATENDLPFRGSLHALETSVVQPPTLFVEGEGSGNATQLGRFTVEYEVEVNLATRVSIGSAQFIAANGDVLSAEIIGQGNPIAGTDFSFIVETYVIIGGTGRFAGASGGFIVERLLNRITGVTGGSFAGTIVLSRTN